MLTPFCTTLLLGNILRNGQSSNKQTDLAHFLKEAFLVALLLNKMVIV